MDRPDLEGRCGACARFVRVVEEIDASGEVRRHGECLLCVWPAPLYEISTCNKYVKRGTFSGKRDASASPRREPGSRQGRARDAPDRSHARAEVVLPEESGP